jgi:phosphoribosylformylglycinamidine cyclo-ligase
VRRIIEREGWNLAERLPWAGGATLADALLKPTRIYVRSLLPLVQQGMIKGLAHITGGGLLENIPRVLPENCHAMIDARGWQLPSLFAQLQTGGSIAPEEMARTFNCGIGMAVIVAPEGSAEVIRALERAGETVSQIGRVEAGPRGCTVRGSAGTWDSPEDWSATHNA